MGIPAYKIAFDGEDASDDIYEYMIRLEIEEDMKKAASFMFRLTMVLQADGEWSFLDDDRLSLFKRVTISIGFEEGKAIPVFEGYITHLAPHFDPEEELCYMEVRGMDPTCLMNLEEKLRSWENQSHSNIASAIFKTYNIIPEVENAPITHTGDGNILVQRGTDIRFLKELAARNGFDCHVAVDDSGEVKGCFKPLALDASPLPPLAVHFEDQTNVQFMDIQVTGNQPLGVAGWHLSLEDKTLEPVKKLSGREVLLGREGLGDIVQSKVDELSAPVASGSRVHQGDIIFLDIPESERSLQALRDRYGWFIKARGIVNAEKYGTAIRARRVVPVKGLGTRYSGNYLVSSVKHLFAEGNYEQHIELIRNAWGVTGDEPFEMEA